MKALMIFLILPMMICWIMMSVTIQTAKAKVDPSETPWFRLHGKTILWVFAFVVNMIFLYMFMFICALYYTEQNVQPSNKSGVDTIATEMRMEDECLKKVNNFGQFVTHVTLTTYNPVEAQCDSDPLVTADGTKIDLNKLKKGEIKYCAISRNLLPFIPLGSVIEIEGYGLYEVRDTMNKRFNHCIDILQHVSEKNFKKTKVKVVKIK